MNDNRKWWKAWNNIIHDAKFQNIGLEDIGFWTLLMCLVSAEGERGKIMIVPPAKVTLALLRCDNLEIMKNVLKRLPNVSITPPLNDNGDFELSILKWFTYQVDPTSSDRVKRSRHKIREDKIREDKSADARFASPQGGSRAPLERHQKGCMCEVCWTKLIGGKKNAALDSQSVPDADVEPRPERSTSET